MKESVVIIGAGINSLVAAADLAVRGRHVVVLEQASYPGGAVATRELTLPGFRHDIGAMNLSAFAGSAFMARHGDALSKLGLEFVHADRPFAQALSPGDHLGISTSIDETLSTFGSERDKETWLSLVQEFPRRSAIVGKLLETPAKPTALAKVAWTSLRSLGVHGSLEMARMLVSSPREWLEDQFEDPRLTSALSSWGMHLDFSPDIAGGAVFPYLEGLGGQVHGMVMPKGGAGRVSETLVKLIEQQGGEVRLGTRVESILHASDVVTGVQTNQGVVVAPLVLANVAPKNLLKLTGPTSHSDFDTALQKFRHGPGTMMIHLALDGPVPWMAEALRRFAYVHIARSIDTASITYSQAVAGLLPEEPVIVVGQPSVYDSSRAPEGKHVLWVQVRVLPAEIKGDAKGQITSTNWNVAKGAMAGRVLDLIEAQAPGFKDLITGMAVVSPNDLEQGNPNLVGGDQVCGSHHLSQNLLFRPALGFADGKTPIRGLHLIGAATWPGGGSGAGSGFMKAQEL